MAFRLGIIAPQFPPEIGGLQTYAFETANELATRGYNVVVLTQSHQNENIAYPGMMVLPILKGIFDQDREVIQHLATEIDCWHVMNAAWAWVALYVSPVILTIHGNDFLNPNPVAGFRVRERLGLPFGSRPDFIFARWNTRRLLRKSVPLMHHIIANSAMTREAFLQQFPSCAVEISVGNVGVSDRFFSVPSAMLKQTNQFRLLTVTRLSDPRKNIDLILEALSSLQRDYDFIYTIVGDGEQRQRLETLSNDLLLGSRVKFAGVIRSEALAGTYRSHDLFVLCPMASSDSMEGFGIVYLEANASGLPVLATRQCGAAEFIEESGSGLLIDEPSVGALQEALEGLMSGRVTINSDVCRLCAERFRWPHIVNHIERCYPFSNTSN